MTDKERNAADNLILLCLEHHTLIDGQPEEYSVEWLLQAKADHEAWVEQQLTAASTTITFEELEEVTQRLVAESGTETTDLTLTPPREKMKKNKLSQRVQRLITIGMVNSPQVGAYLEAVDAFDSTFSARLTDGFVREYSRLRTEGLAGDELFFALQDFSAQNSDQFDREAAGLSVLTYLFEKCELFER